jgi:hypothetical protein
VINRLSLKKTPQTGANAGGQLYEGIDQSAHQQDGQPQINHGPSQGHPSQSRFGDAVAHHGLHRMPFEQSFPHPCMVTNAGRAA